MPAVAPSGMNPGMALFAERNQIALLVCPTFGQMYLVMNLLHWTQHTVLLALLTQRMVRCVAVTDTLPCPAIPTAYSRVTVILLVAAAFLLGVFLTEPAVRKPWTAGYGYGASRQTAGFSHRSFSHKPTYPAAENRCTRLQ